MNIPAFAFGISICLTALTIIVVFPMLRTHRQRTKNIKSAKSKLFKLIDTHKETLAGRRFELVKVDRYGVEDNKEWTEELIHFGNNVWLPQLSPDETAVLGHIPNFDLEIEKAVAPICNSLRGDKPEDTLKRTLH